jgi:RNA recognition motif-containing protein
MEKAHDTIYITNLPDTVTEEKLAEVFGSIGIIKMDRKTEKPKSNEAPDFFHNGSLNTNYCIFSLDLYRQGYWQAQRRW